MKLWKLTLVNYIGIHAASGLSEITIDFTKCKNELLLIIGKNGSGKSTIMEAISPFPDPNDMIREGYEGRKIIEYLYNNILYTIDIRYPIKSDRRRDTVKAFFYGTLSNGERVDYNPNGNVRSFKVEIYDRFGLDPNFLALSQLSSENKGIVNMTPTARKKFASDVLENTETYNNIYKTLCKRSNIFKSMINSIVSKIDLIGDEDKLKAELTASTNKLEQLTIQKESIQNTISELRATVNLMDPDGSIRSTYNDLSIKLKMTNDVLQSLSSLSDQYDDKSIEEILKLINDTKNEITSLNSYIENQRNLVSKLLNDKELEYSNIENKKAQLEGLQSNMAYDELIKNINILEKQIKSYYEIFEKMKIDPNKILDKESYVNGINLMMEIKDAIINMKSSYSKSQIEKALDLESPQDIIKDIDDSKYKVNILEEKVQKSRESISYYNGLLSTMEVLEKRPSSCKINDCEFIKVALEASSKNPSGQIANLSDDISEYLEEIQKEKESQEYLNGILQIIKIKDNIIRMAQSNSDRLSKLPYGEIFINPSELRIRMLNDDNFLEISEMYKYINYANVIDLYNNDSKTLDKLMMDKTIHDSKHQLIESINDDISLFTQRLNGIINDIESANILIEEAIDKLKDLTDKSNSLERAYSTKKRINEAMNNKKDIENRISVVASNISTIEKCISSISDQNSKLISVNNMIKPLSEQVEQYKYSLTKLKEYNEELEVYNGKYQFSEIIKEGASPSKGIQTLFMELYMNRTLNFANDILGLFFDGNLVLQKYDINEDEFRIPCLNKETDLLMLDVKYGSSGQRSIIGMAISFGLMFQASNKYNIVKLDELDGALDQANRSIYLGAVEYVKDLLKVDHCILVSHSIMELNLSNVDIIYLDRDTQNVNGNVIFTYY